MVKKSILSLLDSPIVHRSIAALMSNYAVIFLLHRIENKDNDLTGHSLEFLDQALTVLRAEGYQFVALEDLVECVQQGVPFPKNSLCFTFDDGYFDQAMLAAPVFEQHDCPLSIFMITDFVDGKMWPWYDKVRYVFSKTNNEKIELNLYGKSISYDLSERSWLECARSYREMCKSLTESDLLLAVEQLSGAANVPLPSEPVDVARPMTWGMARELEQRNVRFGPHSETHMIMTKLDRARISREMSASRARVVEELAKPLNIFCFPNGRSGQDFNDVAVSVAKQLGFSSALTTDPGYVSSSSRERFQLDRVALPDNINELLRVTSKMYMGQYWYEKNIGKPVDQIYGGKKGVVKFWASKLRSHVGGYRSLMPPEWSCVKRLVFICFGNVCRSPYAEVLVRRHGVNAVSYGVDTSDGKPANHRAIAIAKSKGVDLSAHVTSRIENYKAAEGDLIIAMETAHIKRFNQKVKGAGHIEKTLLGLCLNDGVIPYIHDPYCASDAYFMHCFDLIDECVISILESMKVLEDSSRQALRLL